MAQTGDVNSAPKGSSAKVAGGERGYLCFSERTIALHEARLIVAGVCTRRAIPPMLLASFSLRAAWPGLKIGMAIGILGIAANCVPLIPTRS